MNYEQLRTSWINQREQYQLWEVRLLDYAKELRNHLENKISLPEKAWIDYETKEENRYVELVDFLKEEKPKRKNPSNTSITSQGALAFGISITFDHGPDTYPKQNIFVPIAIRYKDQSLQHAFFDLDDDEVVDEWITDRDDFFDRFLNRLHDHLSHDPHNGFGELNKKKNRIGFLG